MRATRRDSGTSLLEVLVTTALVGVLASAALLHRSAARGSNLTAAANALAANLRLARATAIGRGLHVRVSGTSVAARYETLDLAGGNWVVTRTRSIDVAAGVTLPADPSWSVEFDARGFAVTPGARLDLEVAERGMAQQKVVSIWPSGQVEVR